MLSGLHKAPAIREEECFIKRLGAFIGDLKRNANCVPSDELLLSIHDSIHHVSRDSWEAVVQDSSPYLRYDYLAALEDAMSGTMDFRYVLYYCPSHDPMGVAYFQSVDFEDNGSKYREAVDEVGSGIGKSIIRDKKVRSLVNGNVFHCGEHGFMFSEGVAPKDQLKAIDSAMGRLKGDQTIKPRASAFLLKDMWPGLNGLGDVLEKNSFHPLRIDHNMVLEVPSRWASIEDYEKELKKKARTRLRAIRKRSDSLERRYPTAAEIGNMEEELQHLFDQVLDRSPFVFGRLNVGVYEQWKRDFGEDLLFITYHLNEELVGFASAFHHRGTLDVHYVGFDYDRNKEHMIYQRMLLDMLEEGIARRCGRIIYGRTAEQAKSNLGAEPVEMGVYVKHRSRLANKLISPLIASVTPTEFETRHPFR